VVISGFLLDLFGAMLATELSARRKRKDGSGGRWRCDGYTGHWNDGISSFGFIFFPRGRVGYPPPVFLPKSTEAFENKG